MAAVRSSPGTKKSCEKGYACGASCIQQSKACEGNKIGGAQKEQASYLRTHAPAAAVSIPPPAPPYKLVSVESPALAGSKILSRREDRNSAGSYLGSFNVTVATPDGSEFRVALSSHRDSVRSATNEDLETDPHTENLIKGLTPDQNGLIKVGYIDYIDPRLRKSPSPERASNLPAATPEEKALAYEKAIVSSGREGDVVMFPSLDDENDSDDYKALFKRMTPISDPEEEDAAELTYVAKIRNGRLEPLDSADQEKAKLGERVRLLRRTQMLSVYEVHNESYSEGRSKKEVFAEEEKRAVQAAKLDDEWVGRHPTPGSVPSEAHYKARARAWAQAQGFSDGGINGFTAAQTRAHDIAHPITHDLLGMDSQQIHQALGGFRQKDGKPSLLGEEAVVNVVEHLSRGDSLENSITNGLRLSRALSRNADVETDEGRQYVRGKEFKDQIVNLANQIYRNNNYNEYMGHVRRANQISGTVTAAGDDFSNTASGG